MTDKGLLEQMIDMADLAKYPFIAYVNPNEPQEVRNMIMETGYVKKVVEYAEAELGRVILMKRTVLEFIETPKPLKPIFKSTNTYNECYVVDVNHSVEEQIKHDRESLVKTIDKLQGKENAKR